MMKYVTELSSSELENNVVIGCESEDNYPCILIKNALNKKQISNLSTDNLSFKLNTVLSTGDDSFYFHIVKSKKNDYISRQQFKVIYDYLFNRITESIDDTTVYELVESLQEYFTITPDIDTYKLQVGVFGELLVIKCLFDSGYKEILKKYHDNFYSKHDIEISDKVRIEIKTTEKETRIHNFRHDQICRDDVNVYVASVRIEPSQEGISLYDLFCDVIDLYNDADATFKLEKLMRRCNISNASTGIKVAMEKAILDILFFDAKDLPMITGFIPKGVSALTYNVDCSFADAINTNEFIRTLMSEII